MYVSKIRLQNGTTSAPRGTDRSPEYNELFCYKLDSRVKNLTTEWNEKQQHFITHASRSLPWIQFVAIAFRFEQEVFWWKGPRDLFCLALDPPLCRYGQNIFIHVPGHEHFIPTKFRKHPLSGSVVKSDYVFPYIYMHLCTPTLFHLNKYITGSHIQVERESPIQAMIS